MSYSMDLRIKAIEAYKENEGTQEEIAEFFGVSLSTFKRWLMRHRRNESLEPIREGKGRPHRIDEEGLNLLASIVETNPSISLAELSEVYYNKNKKIVGRSVLSRALAKLNLRYKKISVKSTEKESEEVKKKQSTTLNN
jgi:transposase